jgi:small-conductance mechanosensitive channel
MDLWRKVASLAAHPVAGNALWQWTAALATALAVVAVLVVVRRSLVRRLRARSAASNGTVPTLLAELLGRVWGVALLFCGIWAGASLLELSPKLQFALRSCLLVLALVQAGLWANALLGAWLQRRLRGPNGGVRSTAALMVGFGGHLAIWTLVFLMSLSNLGIDVTALIAGLGVGGIAVALAVQNVLGDLFASVAIALDKPFEIGDFIILGDVMGTVEHIGLKTTRLRSLFGEQIIVANSDLLASRIRNFKRMTERRVAFTVAVPYRTPSATLEAVVSALKEIVSAQPDLRLDRAHLQKLGDSSVVFEVVYYVTSADYTLYMDRQQAINLEIHRRFAAMGVAFAYPTQTLVLDRPPAREPA